MDAGGPDASLVCVGAVPANALDAMYKPAPAAAKGSCTNNEISNLDKASQNPNAATWDDVLQGWVATNPSVACQSCLVSPATDNEWKTLVTGYEFEPGVVGTMFNWAHCGVAAAPSHKQSCGEIAQKFRYCYMPACDCVKGNDAAFNDCRTASYEDDGVCQDAAIQWLGDCPVAEVNTSLNKCNSIQAVAKVACGP